MEKWRTERFREVSFEFGNILPIYSKEAQAFCRAAFGFEMGKIVPEVLGEIAKVATRNRNEALSYLIWLRDACNYIIDESCKKPETADHNPEDNFR